MAGSSPRVRGTVGIQPRAILPHRFIPARAGNGLRTDAGRRLPAVHPRACGERRSLTTMLTAENGSSPRVRGTAVPLPCYPQCLRFIPARAGNGTTVSAEVSGGVVHPRACGERADYIGRATWTVGSSPRVRGTVLSSRIMLDMQRFIPARAGNGSFTFSPARGSPVHPRACGERSLPCKMLDSLNGSSPRVRGTGPNDYPIQPLRRFIPARAGNGDLAHHYCNGRSVHPRACGERTRRYVIYNM